MNNKRLPRFTIVTPSFQKAKFIEQAIQSVLFQDYPNVEHIILDGGSTDGTVEILKKYSHLTWLSEPDEGQVAALNKGITMAKGEIIGVLNADDYYEKRAFQTALRIFQQRSDVSVLVGNCRIVDQDGKTLVFNRPRVRLEELLQPWRYHFPVNPSAYFYRKKLHSVVGWYQERHGVAFDYEFLLRLASKTKFFYLDQVLGNFRYYRETKTHQNRDHNLSDQIAISKEYWGEGWKRFFSVYQWSYFGFLFIPQLRKGVNSFQRFRSKVAFRTRLRRAMKKTAKL